MMTSEQISALTGEDFPGESEGGGHASGEEKDAVAGRKAPLAEEDV